MKPRVLIVAHGHPDFSKGGAELAAHALYEEINRSGTGEAYLLAAHAYAGLQHTGTAFSMRPGGREFLFVGGTDYFLFSANYLPHITGDFAELLERLQPDVIHFHHYAVVGIEMIRVARQRRPDARILLTLHEYLAICNRNGQMLKSTGALCRQATPAECHVCMPGRTPQDFFLRELYIKSFFDLVDHFIAPSRFLRERYIAWGLKGGRISVIENGQPAGPIAPARPLQEGEPRNRFAYLGQITPFKGLEVVLQAFDMLPRTVRQSARLEIHGTGQDRFDEDFRTRIETLLAKAHRNVCYLGAYAADDLPRIMEGIDWVIVPSIWWENSPLVIQEALKHRRPVICSDIGGMAEKIQHGKTGLHFRVGSAAALADAMERAATSPSLWESLRANIAPPPSLSQTTARLMALYRNAAAAAAQG